MNDPEKQKIITDSSKVNVRYLYFEELQSKLDMAQRKNTESVRRLSYLSMKVSKIFNTEGIQVLKDQNNPFNEQTPTRLLWQ